MNKECGQYFVWELRPGNGDSEEDFRTMANNQLKMNYLGNDEAKTLNVTSDV